jgi:predicted SAM-dependent methyltransferase
MKSSLYVQFGCGWCAPEGWLNFDASPTLRLERVPVFGRLIKKNHQPFPSNVFYGDIIRGLPIEQESCKGVYCSHVLEHLALDELKSALRNTLLLLGEEGVFRFVVPDLRFYAERYVADSSAMAAHNFMKDTCLGYEKRERYLFGFLLQWLGNSKHRWMWDYPSIENELRQAGFQKIRRANYGDSEDSMFRKVEEKERWEDCLGIECVK